MEKLIVAFRKFANALKNCNVNKKGWARKFPLMFQGTVLIGYFWYILVFSLCLSDDEFDRKRKHVATLS